MKRHLKAAAGFTLVELIVVIAILGTLAGVAVPAYGGYVNKANMAADKQLVSDIENALVLAYYADPSSFQGGAIVGLSAEEDGEAYDDFAEDAMTAALGDGWEQTAKLKYDGWKSENIDGSRFKGMETDLLGRVDYLTTSLEKPLNAFAGDNFKKFMDNNGIDSQCCKNVDRGIFSLQRKKGCERTGTRQQRKDKRNESCILCHMR